MDLTRRRPVDTKADAVFFELRDQLIAGERAYGTTLSTAELANEFEVSRRPVMDAIMRLEQAGFIEIIRQVGCRVVVPDRTIVQEHFYVAGALEGAAARLAAEKATDADREDLGRALADSAEAVAADDVRRFERANKSLHTAILDAARNGRLSDVAHSAWNLSDFYLQRRTTQDLRRSHREHEQIVRAIVDGNAAAAREHMEAHLARFGEEALIPGET